MSKDLQQIVERIGQLPKGKTLKSQPWLKDGGVSVFPGDYVGTGSLTTDNLIELSDAYTKAVADNEKLRACAEHYADEKRWPQFGEPAGWQGIHDWYDGDNGNDGYTVAQQTLDVIGKE